MICLYTENADMQQKHALRGTQTHSVCVCVCVRARAYVCVCMYTHVNIYLKNWFMCISSRQDSRTLGLDITDYLSQVDASMCPTEK